MDFFVADRASALDAVRLLDLHGHGAGEEAGVRARRSRDRGNVASFCRWRQIERLLAVMQADRAAGDVALTRH